MEAAHYSIKRGVKREQTGVKSEQREVRSEENRTVTLIDNFLDTIPVEPAPKEKRRRQPTPADATVDYVAYLMEVDESEDGNTEEEEGKPIMKGQNLIDNFIENDRGKIVLSDTVEFTPQLDTIEVENNGKQGEEGFFTETLARIYIKQGRYSKALEIIQRLSLIYPKKNAYFADQIRFLQKLILNNNKK